MSDKVEIDVPSGVDAEAQVEADELQVNAEGSADTTDTVSVDTGDTQLEVVSEGDVDLEVDVK